MLTKNQLQELLDFKAQHPVVSVYLNTEPASGNADTYQLKLRTMLKDAHPPEEDENEIQRYFQQEYDWSGRSVAVFSCMAEGFFRAYPLAVPIRSRIRISPDRPHVKPLLHLIDAYGHYGVAVVDQQKSRLFIFHLGELQAQEETLGESVQRVKEGGSQAGGKRGGEFSSATIKEAVERNMRSAAKAADLFFKQHNVRRVLLGGTEENSTHFRNHLPKHWQSLLMGTFPIHATASPAEVLEKALEIATDAEQQRQSRLVENVITGALKGQNGALGLKDTLQALQEGRVQTLLIQEGLRVPGKRCPECGYLTADDLDSCPYCSHSLEAVPDVIEIASQRVMRAHGEVEFVMDQTLESHGGLGALLRY